MITHNLHTIINADKIIVLDNGKIIDTGTHTHLLKPMPNLSKNYGMIIVTLFIGN